MLKRSHLLVKIILFWCLLVSNSVGETVGPYTGQVFDSRTGEPIIGASVVVYWINCLPGFGGCHSIPIEAEHVYTDTEGKYNIAKRKLNTNLIGKLESTHILIYQPGYVAYFNKSEYLWAKPTLTFPQTNNLVNLERVPPDFNHRTQYEAIEDIAELVEDIGVSNYYTGEPIPFEKVIHRKSKVVNVLELLRRAEWENERENQ